MDCFSEVDNRYGEYFSEYANYYGRPLRLNKSTYGMTNSGKLFYDKITNWMIDEAVFNHYTFQISVY